MTPTHNITVDLTGWLVLVVLALAVVIGGFVWSRRGSISTRRVYRLLSLYLVVVGVLLTVYVVLVPNHGLDDGSMFFPVGVVVGVAALIHYRPSRRIKK